MMRLVVCTGGRRSAGEKIKEDGGGKEREAAAAEADSEQRARAR